MKKAIVRLNGSVIKGASRIFAIEVPDDVKLETLDQEFLESIADEARIPWDFDAEGYSLITDHSVEENEEGDVSDLPVVSLKKFTDSAEATE